MEITQYSGPETERHPYIMLNKKPLILIKPTIKVPKILKAQ